MPTQLITEEVAAKIRLLPFGKKHPVRILLEEMKAGEILRISRQDFNWKEKTPNIFCRQIMQTSKAKFRMYKEFGNTGWVVRRVQ